MPLSSAPKEWLVQRDPAEMTGIDRASVDTPNDFVLNHLGFLMALECA